MPFKRTAEDTLFGARMDIFFYFQVKMVSLGEALNVFILLAVTLTFTSAQDAGI